MAQPGGSGRLARIALVASLLLGCAATSGVIPGRLSLPGHQTAPVAIRFAQDERDTGGTMSITLPDGRVFAGRYVPVPEAAAGRAPWMTAGNPDFSEFTWGVGADAWTFGAQDSDKLVAKLYGARDDVVRCRFQLAYAAGGFRDGGTGQCRLSTGGHIDARF